MTDKEVIDELLETLDCLCDKYIANRGTKSEFITCITPTEKPWYWIQAEQIIKLYRTTQKKEKPCTP